MSTRLEKLSKLAKRSDNLIKIGDWNAVVGVDADRQEVSGYGLGTKNERRRDRLVDVCKEYYNVIVQLHVMAIANIYQNIHCKKRYTWEIPEDIRRS